METCLYYLMVTAVLILTVVATILFIEGYFDMYIHIDPLIRASH